MAAFENALRLGYRYIETDAVTTSDGVVLAFHDPELDRLTDARGRVGDLTWQKVKSALVAGKEPIPRLDEMLGDWPEVRFNIDPKQDAAVAPLADAIRRTGAIDRVCIGSFVGARIARLRKLLGPRLCVSMGPLDVARLRLSSYRLPLGSRRLPCVQVPVRHKGIPVVDRSFVRAAHARGTQVHVWTVDAPAEMHRLLDLGVDGLMTDRPTLLKQVLEERGQWG